MKTEASSVAAVTPAAVAALVSKIESNERYQSGGIIGIAAQPDERIVLERRSPAGHHVRVAACPSTLAVWRAIHEWDGEGWLVILTDRPEEDLGQATLARFVEHRLKTPDPWEAAMQVFGAQTIQRGLLAQSKNGDLATQLVAITPDAGWPVAPGGVLTSDHVFASIAVKYLDLPAGADAPAILKWTTREDATTKISELRASAQDTLSDAVLEWLAGQFGPAQRPVLHILQRGRLSQLAPIGLAMHLLRTASSDWVQEAKIAETRLTERVWPKLNLAPEELDSLGASSRATVEELLARTATNNVGTKVLKKTDDLLSEISARSVAHQSALLPSSLHAIFVRLGEALANRSGAVEEVWNDIQGHPLITHSPLSSPESRRKEAAHAGVRINRWLTSIQESTTPKRLANLAQRQSAEDAWVDTAINVAAKGVDIPELALGLSEVTTEALRRRQEHDRAFAAALAVEGTSSDSELRGASSQNGMVWRIEELAQNVVAPIARTRPTLVLLVDGMSTGIATQILLDLVERSEDWTELVPEGTSRRASALAVLPTLTTNSRTSFFCGELISGGQPQERAGFDQVGRLVRRPGTKLFHKNVLESSQLGFELAHDVADAIAQTQKYPLVGCVLNTIDDALDRSDPAGMTWNEELVKHLRPLLDAARKYDRTVVITSDHGHVVERRVSEKKHVKGATSARSRTADSPAEAGEILVQGSRVLTDDNSAILAIDESLRYTSVKSGYHGGASPAEVVVPVAVLEPASERDPHQKLEGWTVAPTQKPTWWELARTGSQTPGAADSHQTEGQYTFEVFNEPVAGTGAAVIASDVYQAQKAIAGRISVTDESVADLLDALVAQDHRIGVQAVAPILQIPETRVQGAVGQLQKLLNIEGYPVVRMDGGLLVLDAALLGQQFGVQV